MLTTTASLKNPGGAICQSNPSSRSHVCVKTIMTKQCKSNASTMFLPTERNGKLPLAQASAFNLFSQDAIGGSCFVRNLLGRRSRLILHTIVYQNAELPSYSAGPYSARKTPPLPLLFPHNFTPPAGPQISGSQAVCLELRMVSINVITS